MNKFKQILSEDMTSAKLEKMGQKQYKLGKAFMLFGLCGIIALVLISFIVVVLYSPYTLFSYVLLLRTTSGLAILDLIVNIIVFLSYVSILLAIIGFPLYFHGINTFALGRIAVNTEKDKQ